MENLFKRYQHEFILGIFICIYIAYFTIASFLRYDNFYAGRYDLGNMDQTVWNTINGRIFQTSNENGVIISRLSAHADFLLILISPFYLLWSSPKTLLLLQTAVLGLGDIGPEASLPVMEGKCLLFKEFAGVDAFPIVLGTKDVEEIVQTVKNISPGFGGINLEDISAPRCFEIEESLQNIGIPVFHDDQYGTAIVILAALTNALQVVGKNLKNVKVVIMGAGAAGIATAKILEVRELVLVDSKGVVTKNRRDLNKYKGEIVMRPYYSSASNIEEAFKNADVFIGVSGKGRLEPSFIGLMNKKPIIFALSNPNPEILPEAAKKVGAAVVATGRSDFPNQINNVLAFPGVFRGLLDKKAKKVTEKMKLAAATSLAKMVRKPTPEEILPSPLNKNVAKEVAKAILKS